MARRSPSPRAVRPLLMGPTRSPTGIASARPLDDPSLVYAARAGDELAFRRLLRRHHRLLEATAHRFYIAGADEDDTLQEARIGFAKAVQGYREERNTSFRAFAALCVSRQLATAVTAARRGKQRPLTNAARGEKAEQACAAAVDPATPLDLLLAQERLARLAECYAQLSELEREAVSHSVIGYSHEEATRQLGISRKTYDNALQRARAKLRASEQRRAA